MNAFKEREAAAEGRYIHHIEAVVASRLRRVRALGSWGCRLMKTTPEDERLYIDDLYSLALSTTDDRIIVERVHGDLVATGVPVPVAEVRKMLNAMETT